MSNPARGKALGFAKRGYRVLPLHGIYKDRCTCGDVACTSPGKHPCIRHGAKDATANPEIISEWFDEYPHGNYGVCTDELPTIDIDPRNGGDDAWRALLRHGYEPHTWMVATGGGGRHIICGTTATPTPCAKLARGVDLKGVGGYIVGAGSLHLSGKRYKFYADCRPRETPLAPMPVWVTDLVAKPKPGARMSESELNKLLEPALEGERNDRLTKLLGHLYGALRPDRYVLFELAYSHQRLHYPDPLSREEVERIALSLVGRETKKREAA